MSGQWRVKSHSWQLYIYIYIRPAPIIASVPRLCATGKNVVFETRQLYQVKLCNEEKERNSKRGKSGREIHDIHTMKTLYQ